MINIVVVFLIVSLLSVWGVLKVFPKLGLMDRPDRYGYNRSPVPYSAGIILFIIFLLTVFWPGIELTTKMWGLITASSLIVIVSFLDDRFNLSPYLRFACQFVAAAIVVGTGSFVYGFNLPIIGWLEFGQIGGQIITALWLVGLMNAVNWLDGVPGLATGVSGIVFFTLFLLSKWPTLEHTVPQGDLSTISLVLAIGSLVLFFYCVPRLKLLIGDTGSMFLGLMIGALSVYAGGKVATAALVLFIPLFDTIWIILRRILQKKSPFRGDMGHLHHRLLKAGMKGNQIVMLYITYTLLLAILALILLSTEAKFWLGILMLIVLISGAAWVVKLEKDAGQN